MVQLSASEYALLDEWLVFIINLQVPFMPAHTGLTFLHEIKLQYGGYLYSEYLKYLLASPRDWIIDIIAPVILKQRFLEAKFCYLPTRVLNNRWIQFKALHGM